MTTSQSDVIFEDNHLLAVVKTAGVLTQGDATGELSPWAIGKRYLKEKYAKPGDVFLGLVQRLDRPVSGVTVLARTSKAASRLAAQFRVRKPRKLYLAVVEGAPPSHEGKLIH